eukprot:CAMPEP_0175907884 /NCGR_PEP_ID=MMETSP0108-20121206/6300_1 /TAXON_ID=195067 ORGANISM="Goniomonas pacifica, Strain CCMP1869" /NCGR_SAMPLE_ID=MMETSP0108 /ASSEMBLY_ACC=CAM_ASM_000204 /LENGTH=271 /DNA_ID=CAMNT_0017229897 /DNA_START=14 /DNA_END=830 /DNA_ORIENTATION=-
MQFSEHKRPDKSLEMGIRTFAQPQTSIVPNTCDAAPVNWGRKNVESVQTEPAPFRPGKNVGNRFSTGTTNPILEPSDATVSRHEVSKQCSTARARHLRNIISSPPDVPARRPVIAVEPRKLASSGDLIGQTDARPGGQDCFSERRAKGAQSTPRHDRSGTLGMLDWKEDVPANPFPVEKRQKQAVPQPRIDARQKRGEAPFDTEATRSSVPCAGPAGGAQMSRLAQATAAHLATKGYGRRMDDLVRVQEVNGDKKWAALQLQVQMPTAQGA